MLQLAGAELREKTINNLKKVLWLHQEVARRTDSLNLFLEDKIDKIQRRQ